MANQIQIITPKQLASRAETMTQDLGTFLESMNLPTKGVLVAVKERRQVIDNMESAIEPLDAKRLPGSLYISKFVAAAAAGLFDAALNYLWDETIRNLRDKVARFDLAYFFDTVLTDPTIRPKFKDAVDLEKLDDWTLVKGCRETGIITDIGFRHLDYIRDMRNHASAAHPNHNELTGLQLAAWLQTCIKEVLGVEPTGPVVEVRRLLHSLRKETLKARDLAPIEAALDELPPELSRSLMRSLVGMYCDPTLDTQVRANVTLIASAVWNVTEDEGRYEAGFKQATLSANGEVARATLAREFLDIVGGVTYLPGDALAVELGTAIDALESAHGGWNNFHTEVTPAKLVRSLIPRSGAPKSVLSKLVKTVTLCRIGNGHGVSWSASDTYDRIIEQWANDAARCFIRLLFDAEVSSRLRNSESSQQFKDIASDLLTRVSSLLIKKLLDTIINTDQKSLAGLGNITVFRNQVKMLKS